MTKKQMQNFSRVLNNNAVNFQSEEEKIDLSSKQQEPSSTFTSYILRATQQSADGEPMDTECAEFTFACHFLYGNICTQEDANTILTDFNAKKSDRFEEFLQYVPMLDRADHTWISPEDFMRQEMVGLLYGGVKAGDRYCKEMLRMLYKRFYKNEYNQIKRFSILHGQEVRELCKNEEGNLLNIIKASRVLCMANVLDIQVNESCRPYYIAISDTVTNIDDVKKTEQESVVKVIDGKNLRADLQNSPRVDNILKQTPQDKNGNFLIFEKSNSLISRMFTDQGDFIKDYMAQYFPVHTTHAIEYINALISDIGFSDKFSDEEIVLLAPFVAVVSAYSMLALDYKNLLYSFLYPDSSREGDQSSILASLEHLEISDTKPKHAEITIEKMPVDETTPIIEQHDSFEEEIATLKKRLREKESECNELRIQYEHEKNTRKKLEKELDERQSEKIELQRLREYVYSQTEEDFSIQKTSYETMKAIIKDKNIIIIGGNEGWTKKLKNEFPHWKFVGASVSPTVTSNIIKYCEKVYFFTDSISHSNYSKFFDLAKKHNVDFSYMHGVNIQKNVEQVYRDFE